MCGWPPTCMSGFRSRTGRLPSCAIVDFDRLHRQLVIKLFAPLRDQTGKVCRPEETGADRVVASTCLPLLMHSVDGEVYWDGWFSGSPVIFPLVFSGPPDARRAVGRHERGSAMAQGYAKQLVRSTTHHMSRKAGLLISGFASVGDFGVPALTRAQERVRSPITSTATPVSATAAKQQH